MGGSGGLVCVVVGQMMRMVVLFMAGVVFGLKVEEMVKCVWSGFVF